MITRRTRVQLIAFAIITLLGVSFVGARYAKLDRMVLDRSYTVTAHYAQSGGIFAGAEVTYRGVGVGEVKELELTEDGVDVLLDIEDKWDRIPADSIALVGNRSAVGEQYVEIQPQVDDGPYLEDGSELTRTETPIATEKLLGDLADTVGSVDRASLRTTITELGDAFAGTGKDLQRIIDTGSDFIRLADENFDVTTALIRDSNIVLRGQAGTESSLRTFADDLSSFSGALAGADKDLRKVIDSGSFTADQLRTFLEQNDVDLSSLLNNLVTTGRVVVAHLPGLKQMLAIYPYAVAGSFTVVAKAADDKYAAHFGLVLTVDNPTDKTSLLCNSGYGGTDRRGPNDGSNRSMNTKAGCKEPASKSNPRGPQNLPRVTPDLDGRNSTPVATYDVETGKLTWGAPDDSRDALDSLNRTGSVAPASLGEDSWTWLYLQPLLQK